KSRRRLGRRLRRALLQRGGGGRGLRAADRSGTELRVGRQRKYRRHPRLEGPPPFVLLPPPGAGRDRGHEDGAKPEGVGAAHGARPDPRFEAARAIVTKIVRNGNAPERHPRGAYLPRADCASARPRSTRCGHRSRNVACNNARTAIASVMKVSTCATRRLAASRQRWGGGRPGKPSSRRRISSIRKPTNLAKRTTASRSRTWPS